MKLLIADVFAASAVARLRADRRWSIEECMPNELTPESLQGASALLTRSRRNIDDRLLAQAQELQIVVSATSGFDHFDLQSLKSKGIVASYTPDANRESAASHTWALLLGLTRGLAPAIQALRQGLWRESVPRGFELKGHTLGVIGFGRVGSRVAEYAKAFGVQVIAHDPYVESETIHQAGVESVGQSELFRASDVISLHVPLTRETYRMINHATLHNMNPEAFLINTSRGGVVEETELAEALDEGLLRGAALDVFETEPLSKTSKLRGRKNVLLTPHLGGYTDAALEAASHQAVDRIMQWADGQSVSCTLPDCVPWYSTDLIWKKKG